MWYEATGMNTSSFKHLVGVELYQMIFYMKIGKQWNSGTMTGLKSHFQTLCCEIPGDIIRNSCTKRK